MCFWAQCWTFDGDAGNVLLRKGTLVSVPTQNAEFGQKQNGLLSLNETPLYVTVGRAARGSSQICRYHLK